MILWIYIIALFVCYSVIIGILASKSIRYKSLLVKNNIKIEKEKPSEKLNKRDIYKLITNTGILIYDLSLAMSVLVITLMIVLYYLESTFFDGDLLDLAVLYLIYIAGGGTYIKLKFNAIGKYINSNKINIIKEG